MNNEPIPPEVRTVGGAIEQRIYIIKDGKIALDWVPVAPKLVRGRPFGSLNRKPKPASAMAPCPEGVDWDLDNISLAAKHKTTNAVIAYWRKQVGHAKLCGFKYAHIKWREIDWTKNNQEISVLTGAQPGTVCQIRHKLLQPASKARAWSTRVVDDKMIAAIDWELERDADIGKKWKVTRERVRQIRQHLNKPPCKLNTIDPMSKAFEVWMHTNRPSIEGKLAKIVADECPITLCVSEKLRIMKKSGIPFNFKKWRKGYAENLPVNWQIPSGLLNAIWDRGVSWATSSRHRYSKPDSSFMHQGQLGIPNMYDHCMNELGPIVQAELNKAVALGITPKYDKIRACGFKIVEPIVVGLPAGLVEISPDKPQVEFLG